MQLIMTNIQGLFNRWIPDMEMHFLNDDILRDKSELLIIFFFGVLKEVH